MSTSELEQSIADGGHYKLQALIGNWIGVTKTWFEPGVLSDESPIQGTIRPLFDSRFILHEYKSSLQGKPFEGRMILGFYLLEKKYQMSWVDTFHMGTGIMLSESEKNAPFFSVLGQYGSGGEAPEFWGWKTTIEKPDPDKLIIRAFNISPEGEEALATETIYSRINK